VIGLAGWCNPIPRIANADMEKLIPHDDGIEKEVFHFERHG
jgi:uncharacterized membrane protein